VIIHYLLHDRILISRSCSVRLVLGLAVTRGILLLLLVDYLVDLLVDYQLIPLAKGISRMRSMRETEAFRRVQIYQILLNIEV